MNDYSSLRKVNKKHRLMAVVVLALCVVVSSCMLCARLMPFAPQNAAQYIPLPQSNGITKVRMGKLDDSGKILLPSAAAGLPGSHFAMARLPKADIFMADPGFQTSDENTVWVGETDVEIFKLSYENGTGEVTVHSDSGMKVLAPGTSNSYSFTLENTGDVGLDYTLTMEAYFSDSELPIPIFARVSDGEGAYLVGSAEEMADVLELNNVSQEGKIKAGYVMPYTLEWEWPFELDDEYDTMLGNLATEQDITLTIVIKTTATYNPAADGGFPQTGDMSDAPLLIGLMALSVAGIVVLLLLRRREEGVSNG